MSAKKLPIILLAFANEQEDEHAYLRKLNIEQRELRKTLNKLEDDDKAEVEILHGVTVKDLFDFFQHEKNRGRVAIFHYAGHANSFQFLMESEDGSNQSAHGEGIISFLNKQEGLKLVVLNGCSTEGHALQLAEGDIATIATSNSIDDQVATDFAIRFYSGLVNDIELMQAFDEAADYIKTLKGSANMRDLYWDGLPAEETPNTVPWHIYEPTKWPEYRNWTVTQAYEALNITLAEQAQRAWKKAVEEGKITKSSISHKYDGYKRLGRMSSMLKTLAMAFRNPDDIIAQYVHSLRKEFQSADKQRKNNLISGDEFKRVEMRITSELNELVQFLE